MPPPTWPQLDWVGFLAYNDIDNTQAIKDVCRRRTRRLRPIGSGGSPDEFRQAVEATLSELLASG